MVEQIENPAQIETSGEMDGVWSQSRIECFGLVDLICEVCGGYVRLGTSCQLPDKCSCSQAVVAWCQCPGR